MPTGNLRILRLIPAFHLPFQGVEKNVKRSLDIVKKDQKAILADVAPSKKARYFADHSPTPRRT